MHQHIVKVEVETPYRSTENPRPRYHVTLHVDTSDPIKLQALISAACFEIERDAADAAADAAADEND